MRPNNFHGSHSKTFISEDLREHKRRGKPFIEQTQPKHQQLVFTHMLWCKPNSQSSN